jgi:virulence factor Mce-like protein
VIKQAPSPARLAAMVVFALSCFGLLLFLWLSFGGPVPLKPKAYRIDVAFPEATQLGLEADVRVSGVSVGRVVDKRLDDDRNRTVATLELDAPYAPLPRGARAMLRQKTLLGETYVELTLGRGGPDLPEGGRLADGRVADAVQLDEIFQAFDPRTRAALRTWQQDLARGVRGRGSDLNAALGTLPGFASDAGDVLEVLDTHERALARLVRNTGAVFGALSEDERQLRTLVTGSSDVFAATASQAGALAQAVRIFPTFLDESKATLARLRRFAADTDPLIRDLRPAMRDLAPTVRDVRALAPDLRRSFRDLDPLVRVSRSGLPALRDTLRGVGPMLGALGPFLAELNPILQYLEVHQADVSDFISNGTGAIADTTQSTSGGIGHYLRQVGVEGVEAAAVFGTRLPTNRGNSYLGPLDLYPSPKAAEFFMFPNYDCVPTGGKEIRSDQESGGRTPGCYVAEHRMFQGRLQGRFPHVEPASDADPAKARDASPARAGDGGDPPPPRSARPRRGRPSR